MLIADCKPPEMTYLIFGVGLPNNQASTVKKALQDTVMYLQMHGLPVYRFHSGRVLQPPVSQLASRSWCFWYLVGARAPQSNGHAESTVRWLKDRTRTLLRSAGLPVRLWPVRLDGCSRAAHESPELEGTLVARLEQRFI